jgi:heme exporter protein A
MSLPLPRPAAALQLEAISCARGGRTLFTNLSQRLAPGELLRVLGANGAGKTSLLRMVCGLLEPTSGQVLWRGQKLAAQRALFGAELVYVGHGAALKDELSPLENLLDACALGGRAASAPDALAALRDAGLRGHERTPARRLSQGQRRRSSLARLALSQAAPLWVLDEPFNTLDTAATAWLTGLIQTHLKREGMVLLTSHQDIAINASAQVLTL